MQFGLQRPSKLAGKLKFRPMKPQGQCVCLRQRMNLRAGANLSR